jgi:hypothetical protein
MGRLCMARDARDPTALERKVRGNDHLGAHPDRMAEVCLEHVALLAGTGTREPGATPRTGCGRGIASNRRCHHDHGKEPEAGGRDHLRDPGLPKPGNRGRQTDGSSSWHSDRRPESGKRGNIGKQRRLLGWRAAPESRESLLESDSRGWKPRESRRAENRIPAKPGHNLAVVGDGMALAPCGA